MASRVVKLGLVQMAMVDKVTQNLAKATRAIDEAAKDGADIVCLPELFAWRYFPATRESLQAPQPIPGKVSEALSLAARKHKIAVVGGSIYERAGASNYNTCLTFDEEGRTIAKYRKVHIPQDDHYFEQDYFKAGSGYSIARTAKAALGTLICFDQWYPEAARVNRLMGAEILFYPTAIGWVRGIEPVEGDWKEAWEAVQVGHAIANSVVVCAVNRVGREGDTTFWGGSFVCDQFGKVLFRAGEAEGVFTVECDLRLGETIEGGWGFMRNRRKRTYSTIAE